MNNSKYEGHTILLTSDQYVSNDCFSFEIKTKFEFNLLTLGFEDDKQNNEGFVTTQIVERGILVQKFQGELQAFRNLCCCLFSRIQIQRSCNRPLQFPYQGWTHDA